MEIARNNHQSHHHQRLPLLSLNNVNSSNNSSNSAVAATNGESAGSRSPFQREVREWQHIDPDTGALLTGRLEADRWANGPMNSYGKISDSQNFSQPNGTQHTQRKQLEVLQARTPNGAMQVIRTQKVQTTSSRWSSSTSSASSPLLAINNGTSSNLYNHHNSHNNYLSHLITIATTKTSSCKTNNHWPKITHSPKMSPTVDICETDDGDCNGVDDIKDQHHLLNNIQRLHYCNNGNNSNNLLLLDTAPSLKLSNLMKSSSSISSNNSSSNNSIVAAAPPTAVNTHQKSAGKVSLHAIVGNNNESDARSSLRAKTSATTSAWQQHGSSGSGQCFEQPALYGNNNKTLIKSRVGVSNYDETCGGGNSVDGGDSGGVDTDIGDYTATLYTDQQRHHQQKNADLTPTQLNRQQQCDLESFRHYNDLEHGSIASSSLSVSASHYTSRNDGGDDEDNDDDNDNTAALRLTSRHQRRQQIPFDHLLQRSRSISTDDLSTEWDTHGGATDEPSEWRRVSKLRRSFQSTTTTTKDNFKSITTRRPHDLPTSLVSVSKIRAELENGRRLNTAMRNNQLDFAALNTILNSRSTETKPTPAKRTTFLTAESLKEIRGKLKRLSDESLYKEDFISNQKLPGQEEQIEMQHCLKQSPDPILPKLVLEKSAKVVSPKSAFHVVGRRQRTTIPTNSSEATGEKHTTNSLESRQKSRDTGSTEWHIRRKSYGFEKMSPPDDKSMFRMDASTDSGLGRSGELGNWSPSDGTTSAVRSTVIHFGEPAQVVKNTTTFQKRYRQFKSPTVEEDENEVMKRHSIAVDESKYVRDNLRKTSQVHLSGFYDSSAEATSRSLQPMRYENIESSSSASLFQRNQQKRVEFCKTEVHFAAESGRVNIVETDGKPPPTNNFRRRRRTTSGPLQNLVKSASNNVALPITHFGDDHRRKTVASTTVAYKTSLMDASDILEPSLNVTVSIPKLLEPHPLTESTRNSYASTSGMESTDGENDEISAIRGILKNKPIKPKPYHLGENIDSPDVLWGIQLKPVTGSSKNDAPQLDTISTNSEASVADRVRIAEKRQDPSTLALSSGYSTKINLSLGSRNKDWSGPGEIKLDTRRPSAQELMLQDLREHQRILDEGLKSTSLIIKTMRSANEFDEAMRRLSIASMEAVVIQPIVVPTPLLRSNSYQESLRRYSITSLNSNEEEDADVKKTGLSFSSISPTAIATNSFNIFKQSFVTPSNLKLSSYTEIPVSEQLAQLKRIYDVAALHDDDSADEEVKSYFHSHNDMSDSGGCTQENSSLEEEHSIEYSGSWSRLKTKRILWKNESADQIFESPEITKSNVMSIELHSPQTALSKKEPAQSLPVAKPRNISAVPRNDHASVHSATTAKQQMTEHTHTTDSMGESLKIVKETRGARKLRDHELSYFGVPVVKHEANVTKPSKLLPKRTLPQRKTHEEPTKINQPQSELHTDKQTTKWHLISDKPDLLRHSPIAVEPMILNRIAEIRPCKQKNLRMALSEEEESILDEESDEHHYENITNELRPVFKIKSSADLRSNYDRKTDLKRDAMILSEMTKNADQTLRDLSDEAAHKDQRRRSLHRRNSKPLETIDEKAITEKINDTCVAVKVTRSTLASEAKRILRHSIPSPTTLNGSGDHFRSRTSSQSSVESCPRARSRSFSSEREYENVRVRSKSVPKSRHSKPLESRSSSRGSQTSLRNQYSSGDEVFKEQDHQLRLKVKRVSTASSNQRKDKHGKKTEHERKKIEEKRQHLTHNAIQPADISTKHSSQRERIKCSTEPASTSHNRSRHSSDLSARGRGRKVREQIHSSTEEKHQRNSHPIAYDLERGILRGHEREKPQRSSNRIERSTDKDKEKLKRSKGHSTRTTLGNNSEQHTAPQRLSTTKHSKTGDQKRPTKIITSSNIEAKPLQQHQQHDNMMIHSKNTQVLNGHHQHYYQQQHGEQHPHNNIQSMTTTTTIAAKHRERNGKDRK